MFVAYKKEKIFLQMLKATKLIGFVKSKRE
jgi:hypothetical protein